MKRMGAQGSWALLVGAFLVVNQSGCSSPNDTSLFGTSGYASSAMGGETPQGGAGGGNASGGSSGSGAGRASTVGAGGTSGGLGADGGALGANVSGHAGALGNGGYSSNGANGGAGVGGSSGMGSVSGGVNAAGAGGMSGGGGGGGVSGAAGSGGTSGAVSLLISQIQTRSTGGGTDELVEIYNPTDTPVTFDDTWALTARADATLAGCTSNLGARRFMGGGQSIPAHGYLLYTGALYSGAVRSDGAISTGIADGGNVVLTHGGVVADAVCYYFNADSLAGVTGCSTPYVCEGTPVLNPHDNTAATNINASLERKPGGVAGNRMDTNDNASDFQIQTPAEPRGSTSAPSN